MQDITEPGLRDPSELDVIEGGGQIEGYVTNQGDSTPLVFDFNLGAIVPVTVPTQQVAALTPLNEAALPTVATLATVPDLSPRNSFSEFTAPPTELGSVPVVSVELAALESGPLGEDTGADGLGDGNTPADDLGERERDPQGQDKDAALTEELSGLNETIERGLQEMRDLRDRLLNLDDRPGGMDGAPDALDEVFRQGWPGVEQTFDSGNVMVERGLDALRSATARIQPALETVSQAMPISNLHWREIATALLDSGRSLGRTVGDELYSRFVGQGFPGDTTVRRIEALPEGEAQPHQETQPDELLVKEQALRIDDRWNEALDRPGLRDRPLAGAVADGRLRQPPPGSVSTLHPGLSSQRQTWHCLGAVSSG